MRITSGVLLASFPIIGTGYLYWALGGAAAGFSAALLLTGIFLVTGSAFQTIWAATLLYTTPYVIAASAFLITAFPSLSSIEPGLSKTSVFLPALLVLVGIGIVAEYEERTHSGWMNPTSTIYNLLIAFGGIFTGWLVVLGTGRTDINVSPLVIPFLILILPLIATLKENTAYEKVVLVVEVKPKPGSIIADCGKERRRVPIRGWGTRPTRLEIELETAPVKVTVWEQGKVKELKCIARGIDSGTLFLLYREEG